VAQALRQRRGPALSRRRGALATGRRPLPYLFVLPGLAFYLIFTVYPVLRQFQMSFQHWQAVPGTPTPFVGLRYYAQALHDPVVHTAAINSVLYTVVTVPTQMLLGLTAANLLHRRLPARWLWRTLIYLPVVTSWVIASYVFAYLFNTDEGLINAVLGFFAGHPVTVDWLQNTWTSFVVIWLLAVWKGIGWSMIMFLAGLTALDRTVVESGQVDGAHGWRLWWHVILPQIRPTAIFVFVMLVIGSLQAFISIFLLTAGGPYNSTQVLLTYTYQLAFSFFNFGYAAALASMLAVVLFLLSAAEIRLLRERRPS
jgi:multiple sugar transport system permease protein